MIGFYSYLHDLLKHLLSSAPSCWPDAARPPMAKASKKHGGIRPSGQIETMALAGVLASGYDALKYGDRKFLQICDEYESGMITLPELYAQMDMYLKKKAPWNRLKYYRVKRRVNQKVTRLRKRA